MSTELLLQSMSANLPVFAGEELDTGLMALASAAPPRITTKGGRISAIIDGAVAAGPVNELDVIVIGVFPEARLTSRVFYAGQYKEGENKSPTCFSDKGDVPSQHAEQPQAASCATCPQNIKGSSSTGGTACGYYKRLAVMLPGIPDMVFELRVSVKGIVAKPVVVDQRSWMGLNSYSSLLAAYAQKNPHVKMDMAKVITTISCPMGQTEGVRFTWKNWAAEVDYRAAVEAVQSGARDKVLQNRVDIIDDPVVEQPAHTTPPAQPAYTAPPAQPAYTAPPAQPVNTAPPAVEPPPAQPAYTAPPAQPQVNTAPPAQPAYTAPPVNTAPPAVEPPPAQTVVPEGSGAQDMFAAIRARMNQR